MYTSTSTYIYIYVFLSFPMRLLISLLFSAIANPKAKTHSRKRGALLPFELSVQQRIQQHYIDLHIRIIRHARLKWCIQDESISTINILLKVHNFEDEPINARRETNK